MKQSAIICIVDNDDGVRSSLQNYLRAAGLSVRTFDSAETFLASSDSTTADCLVTDLHMPGIGGMALQRELNRTGSSVPVIVMTAFPAAAARLEAARLGAVAFLEKPIDPDALLEELEGILPWLSPEAG